MRRKGISVFSVKTVWCQKDSEGHFLNGECSTLNKLRRLIDTYGKILLAVRI